MIVGLSEFQGTRYEDPSPVGIREGAFLRCTN